MKAGVVLVEIDGLKTHEAVSQKRVRQLVEEIGRDGYLRNPVVADKESLVILDGHHRLEILKQFGVKKIPVFLVDYMSDQVRVYLRRKELAMELIKQAVVRMGRSTDVFPEKTTRHLIKNRVRGINLALKKIY